MNHAMYLGDALRRPRATVEASVRFLAEHSNEFEGIVCTGLSGLLIAPMIAMELGKTLAVVRKRGDCGPDNNHSICGVETTIEMRQNWIFIDDIISTGNSVLRVRKEMVDLGYNPEVATYLYCMRDWRNTFSEFPNYNFIESLE